MCAMKIDDGYSLQDLCDETGVTPRTVRYYIKQGLLPAAVRTGPGVRYSEPYAWRIRLIRHLKGDYLPLAEIRRLLETMPDEQGDATQYQEWAAELTEHVKLIQSGDPGGVMAEAAAASIIKQWEQGIPELKLKALLNRI